MKKHVIFYSLLAIIILILSGFLINNVTKIDKMNIDYNTLQTEFSKIQKDLAETKALLADKDLELITIKAERDNLANNLTELQTKNNNLTTEITKLKEQLTNQKTVQQTNQTPIQTPVEPTIPTNKTAYLTFDDGTSANTITILDTLKAENIKATFFLNGNYNKDIVKRIIDEGHAIGNHTQSHSYKDIYKSTDAFLNDFNTLENSLMNDFGVKPLIMRFPGGSNNTVSHKYGGKGIMTELKQIMTNKGYVFFDWNVTSGDADSTPATKEQIISNVISRSKTVNNAIILMHDSGAKTETAKAVPEIIKQLRELGFSFGVLTTDSPKVQFK